MSGASPKPRCGLTVLRRSVLAAPPQSQCPRGRRPLKTAEVDPLGYLTTYNDFAIAVKAVEKCVNTAQARRAHRVVSQQLAAW
jgi:hypothetical protein